MLKPKVIFPVRFHETKNFNHPFLPRPFPPPPKTTYVRRPVLPSVMDTLTAHTGNTCRSSYTQYLWNGRGFSALGTETMMKKFSSKHSATSSNSFSILMTSQYGIANFFSKRRFISFYLLIANDLRGEDGESGDGRFLYYLWAEIEENFSNSSAGRLFFAMEIGVVRRVASQKAGKSMISAAADGNRKSVRFLRPTVIGWLRDALEYRGRRLPCHVRSTSSQNTIRLHE